ncbi:hypothetical protein [Streptomyces sp. FL07-04A]|uniref:hypothetical protein n=1 Tax=Streptomyces sp. FL07-04A TaxID=3028658 RepID=UPI0029AC1A40|nr:hypothetical protein [Streptomyces sp. FL07-04A]MDX3579933.1 hypothetical protein [Streptomyces sp. FL07-04A]
MALKEHVNLPPADVVVADLAAAGVSTITDGPDQLDIQRYGVSLIHIASDTRAIRFGVTDLENVTIVMEGHVASPTGKGYHLIFPLHSRIRSPG